MTAMAIDTDIHDLQLMMRSLSTYRFYPFAKRPHPGFIDLQKIQDDLLHDKIGLVRDQVLAGQYNGQVSLLLTPEELRQVLVAAEGCYEEMFDCPNDLHTMLDLNEPDPLRHLAKRLRLSLEQSSEM